ncbi:isohexenylglutaconyl-CoA hydratase [soil metagenome]
MLTTLDIIGPVARLTLNRPEQRNALSLELLRELHSAADRLAGMPVESGPRVLVITGAGKAFCAGMDLKQVVGNEDAARELLRTLATLTFKLRMLPMTLLAVVNGAAIGGGCGVVTVCDLAVTFAENTLGFPEVDLGVCPAVVAPWLVRKVGPGRARRILLSGGTMNGTEAHDLGLVSHLAPSAAELTALSEGVIARLATAGPAALRATRQLLNELDGSTDEAVLSRAADLSAEVLNSAATQELLRAKMGV